ncbi:hypothetical protein A1Q1_04306 [Trichosporon asahii var. asahii CBS 2479]|uniref:Uncharacterized protein n=1 Tax=Trichosporon asahii var. asahii (strain ATCC 90039 / CBS 2479 / JCM 2466 / KCTC 7840 / NBRC 103889/ NCYC 2677 / UAMH 7654) TaxID=1186058 RepID=J5QFD8_TRIAS|nr:hypothetical protein A1Q1_04306 [Trichosporon asahii var. asahii CBS 2479]EJT47063.1 hypothetical protein A1Q1_04306 [Trichosporon asahii var. asahii CBS 2479]
MDDDDPPTPELPSVPEPSQKEVFGDSPTQAESPTEPEVVRPRQQSSPPSPPPSRTVVTRRRSPLPVDGSDDEVVMIGESPAPPSYKRLRASAPQQERRVIPRSGTKASPYSVPDTPLRELSRTVSPPTSGSRRTLPRRPSSQSALPEEVRYRLARKLRDPPHS